MSAACGPSSWESKCFRPKARGGGYGADTRGTTQHPLQLPSHVPVAECNHTFRKFALNTTCDTVVLGDKTT